MFGSASPELRVPYRAWHFPPDVVRNSGELVFSANALADVLFTTGRAPGDRWSHGSASVYEWLHRVALVPAYLRCGDQAELLRSKLATTLDPSEKGALSYSIGQAMTAIFCEQMLGVRDLMHVDRYMHQNRISFAGPKRPDLFGENPDGWVIAEAKGSSGELNRETARKLVIQKRSVRSINGHPPKLALGCIAHHPRPSKRLVLKAYDPEEENEDAVDLSIDRDRYVFAYHLPFVRAIELGDAGERLGIATATFANLGLEVGLARPLLQQLREAEETGQLRGLAERTIRYRDQGFGEDGGRFVGGRFIRTTWNRDLTLDDRDG
ncbi:hypothetical protein [Actinosynnema pretiosum]|uniref:Uncharacterized protein n=1 Tax=Actinosynnema pretiosum TaxID=42197 RepID=A0A290Z075_9PSEU|nr:hypothetical protein [Actinosynnema pretiosum]ATE52395.1 hypothetical protein CNX65_03050 [Actinosynnema pretiosum]